jgi:hypothetical protein
MPAATAASKKPLLPRQAKLTAATDAAQKLRGSLRDAVCVEPKYPGTPADYRYLPHRCVRKGEPGSAKGKPTGISKAAISAADTQREIKALQKAVDAYGKDHQDLVIENTNVWLMTVTFEAMISTKLRKQFPNPVDRYDYLMDKYRKQEKAEEFFLPRFTIFRLTLASLKSTQ